MEEIEKRWRLSGGQGEVKIVAQLKNGVERSAVIAHSKGTTENPMTEEEIREKFLLLAGRRLSPERCKQIVSAVSDLGQIADVRELTELFRTAQEN